MSKHKIDENDLPVIIFNNVRLPYGAIFIDLCASKKILKEVSEELSLWFWKFTICVEKEKNEKSANVINNANKLRELIIDNKESVRNKLRSLYVNEQVDIILCWWLETLEIMIDTASERDVSSWVGATHRGQPPTLDIKGSC